LNSLGRAFAATRHFRPVLALVILLFAYFSITQPVFATGQNLQNMLTGVSVLWVVAMGMTFVVLTGGVDLSVGAVASLIGIMLAKLLGLGLPAGIAIVVVVIAGALIGGVLNGLLVGRLNLSFFVVTLASMTALTGIVNIWAQTKSFFVTDPLITKIGVEDIAGLPTSIWIMIAVFLLALYVQQATYFGRDVYAVGGSVVAAKLSGIRSWLTITSVYAISGAAAALGGIIATGRLGSATPQVENNLPLQAAAGVLLGGTSLLGGSGGVGGTALGVLFIGILQNGLSISGVNSFWQQVVTGVILVVAILGDRIVIARGSSRGDTAGPSASPSPEPAAAATGAES